MLVCALDQFNQIIWLCQVYLNNSGIFFFVYTRTHIKTTCPHTTNCTHLHNSIDAQSYSNTKIHTRLHILFACILYPKAHTTVIFTNIYKSTPTFYPIKTHIHIFTHYLRTHILTRPNSSIHLYFNTFSHPHLHTPTVGAASTQGHQVAMLGRGHVTSLMHSSDVTEPHCQPLSRSQDTENGGVACHPLLHTDSLTIFRWNV